MRPERTALERIGVPTAIPFTDPQSAQFPQPFYRLLMP